MFTRFFYTLKERKVPVSITEWMTLMEVLSQGHIHNLDDFYYIARAVLVKSEAHFDHYDVAFQEYFKGIEAPKEITQQILEWLKDPLNRQSIMAHLTPGELEQFQKMDLDELMKEFEKRMAEQKEQHDGGGYWIGRGGTSPFGHGGRHPAGIRIGGEGGGRSAIKVAQERRFRNYRSDVTLDVRQIKVALRGLRMLTRVGPEDELDLEGTIDKTCKNAGEIDLVWRRRRKNTVKLLLLMDSGGSMDPYVNVCTRLFSAAHSARHFKEFKYYYFHNCIYDNLWRDMEQMIALNTEEVLKNLDRDYKVILVGDGRMGTTELTERWGSINYYERNDTPGIMWLKRFADHFSHSVWLNPESPSYWQHPTVMMIRRLFPMYELTIDGLNEAIRKLIVKK
ncbi:MAG: VWA domain-containing protein [Chloroflexi bacterium]|nr:VWA domain-containing protein [Chloroflexota bacterium]